MAIAARYLSRSALLSNRKIPTRRKPPCPIRQSHPFHSTFIRRNDDDHDYEKGMKKEFELMSGRPFKLQDYLTSSPEMRTKYDRLAGKERTEFEENLRARHEYVNSTTYQEWYEAWCKYKAAANEEMNSPRLARAVSSSADTWIKEFERENPAPPLAPFTKKDQGYWAQFEEDDAFTQAPDQDEWQGDDITSDAHRHLEQHREARDYARLAAWELPLLSRLARPFQPPALNQPLRFRYTTYMGEHHPAERKICLEFCTADLLTPNGPLKSSQRNKLIKLLGVRYNPSTDLAKISCEKFETQAQNKRSLGDLVDSLIKEAQDETDTFNEVPFDYRHHKPKSKPTFPAQWRMTEARQRYLASQRQERLAANEEKKGEKLLIDGIALLEEYGTTVRMNEAREAEEHVRAESTRMEARSAAKVGRQSLRT